MYVIGTAGHVDHGKSTLVEALTGIDPDRLAEEKEREMTIELGFAWLTLPLPGREATEVGVIDVPGHRDFIENMLAGVGGIDLALLVIAADEGVMPQTREHLAILDLLQVNSGVVALTKVDLIDDPDWLELVTLDVSELLSGTPLRGAAIVPVSARTGQGLDRLRKALGKALTGTTERLDEGRPRLPIDRVFTLSGFGTVVTGTLVGGSLKLGDAIEVQPGGLKGRVRGLQTHRQNRPTAEPGSRVAVNVSGIERDALHRGQVLARPDLLRETVLFDAAYRHLPDAGMPLRHNMEVKLFVGAAEIVGRTRVLGARQIAPGQEGWLQLALREPAALARDDRFILRLPSPGLTLGGGTVLDPHPGRRHRRFRPEVMERLETLARGTPADRLLHVLRRQEPVQPEVLQRSSGLDTDSAVAAWEELVATGRVVLAGGLALSAEGRQRLRRQAETSLGEYHRQYPLRAGMPREELRSRLGAPAMLFNQLLDEAEQAGALRRAGALVRLAAHAVTFTPEQSQSIQRLTVEMEAAGVNTPSVKQCRSAVGDAVFAALVEMGRLHQLNQEVAYTDEQYQAFYTQILRLLEAKGSTNAAEVRDRLQTSRKYAIAWLEHLDELRVTRREGDERVLVANRDRPPVDTTYPETHG